MSGINSENSGNLDSAARIVLVMARKQSIEEFFFNSNDVGKEIPIASVYVVLTSISPVKKGRKQNYFKGTVCDESSTLRLVGFNTKLQKQMSDMMSKKKAIEIKNCEITPSRRGEKMEILLKSDSSINESTRCQK